MGAGAVGLLATAALVAPSAGVSQGGQHDASIKHVPLISVDGLHQSDLATSRSGDRAPTVKAV
jgi:hypothetical protein